MITRVSKMHEDMYSKRLRHISMCAALNGSAVIKRTRVHAICASRIYTGRSRQLQAGFAVTPISRGTSMVARKLVPALEALCRKQAAVFQDPYDSDRSFTAVVSLFIWGLFSFWRSCLQLAWIPCTYSDRLPEKVSFTKKFRLLPEK